MELARIYQPIEEQLQAVEDALSAAFKESERSAVVEIGDFIMASGGKRIRPALVILAANACSNNGDAGYDREQLVAIAMAVELIHIASLVHDDVIDRASVRHNRPTINSKWRDEISVVFGDYVYSKAFKLISECRNADIFSCISEAISVMCEGELAQVCGRGDMDLSKEDYIVIVKKKTASLFEACCHAGTIVGNHGSTVQSALKNYGMNFGIAFQIADDCRDIIGDRKESGKSSGQDISVGEMTLPMMSLLDTVGPGERARLTEALAAQGDGASMEGIRKSFLGSGAVDKTRQIVSRYIGSAKEGLGFLDDSEYKESLGFLADYIFEKTF